MSIALLFVIIGAVAVGYYVWSCIRYPRVPCRWCGGKAPRDPVMRRPFGQCGHCGGKGWQDRLGTRMIGRRSK
jgi:hypothetical protein